MDAQTKRKWLSQFESQCHLLISGSSEPPDRYGEGGSVTEFFAKYGGANEGMWCNGHMYLAQGKSPEQAAAIWYANVARPLLAKMKQTQTQTEEVTHGET